MPIATLLEIIKQHDGEVPSFAWPSGYPLYYIVKDGETLSPETVRENFDACLDPNESQWFIVGYEINYENTDLYCAHSGKRIESAYCG